MQQPKLKSIQSGKSEEKLTMKLSKRQLDNLTDAGLLQLVITFHQLNHQEINAKYDIANALETTEQTISNHLAGRGQFGPRQLKKLLAVTGCDIIDEWMNRIWNETQEGQ